MIWTFILILGGQNMMDQRFYKSARHTMQEDPLTYNDDIAKYFGAKPDLLRNLPFAWRFKFLLLFLLHSQFSESVYIHIKNFILIVRSSSMAVKRNWLDAKRGSTHEIRASSTNGLHWNIYSSFLFSFIILSIGVSSVDDSFSKLTLCCL